jgi:hypothetical protein
MSIVICTLASLCSLSALALNPLETHGSTRYIDLA